MNPPTHQICHQIRSLLLPGEVVLVDFVVPSTQECKKDTKNWNCSSSETSVWHTIENYGNYYFLLRYTKNMKK